MELSNKKFLPERTKFVKILILVTVLSISLGFGLGYLSTFNLKKTPIIIEKCGAPLEPISN